MTQSNPDASVGGAEFGSPGAPPVREAWYPEMQVGGPARLTASCTPTFPQSPPAVRGFDSGAVRDTDDHKYDYEGFLSPLVVKAYGEYMHENRRLKDGSTRASDNWQKGIPNEAYAKSAWRHHHDWWMIDRGYEAVDFDGEVVPLKKALCALIFNASGRLHSLLVAELPEEE